MPRFTNRVAWAIMTYTILVEIIIALVLFSMVCYRAFTLLVEGHQN